MANVLITGGSQGIGRAAARLFAQEGWSVAVNYNSSRDGAEALVRELAGLGVGAVPIQADVSLPERAEGLVREAEAALGPLDALVCSAGVALPQQLLTDTTDRQWRQLMAVDLDGMFYTLRAAIPGMVRRKRGAIVTVSSMWGVTGGSCEVPYSAAKAGVIGLTRALAKELGRPGGGDPSGPHRTAGGTCSGHPFSGLGPGLLHHRPGAECGRRNGDRIKYFTKIKNSAQD